MIVRPSLIIEHRVETPFRNTVLLVHELYGRTFGPALISQGSLFDPSRAHHTNQLKYNQKWSIDELIAANIWCILH